MQNKANFRKSQMNVTKLLTRDYEIRTLGQRGKNKANSKPNKANLQNAQMNVNKVSTRDYDNILNWVIYENKANFNPKQTQTKPILSRRSLWRRRIKPNLSRRSLWRRRIQPNLSRRSLWRRRIQPAYDLFTNKILAFVAAAGDNKDRISIENFRKSIVNSRRRFRNE